MDMVRIEDEKDLESLPLTKWGIRLMSLNTSFFIDCFDGENILLTITHRGQRWSMTGWGLAMFMKHFETFKWLRRHCCKCTLYKCTLYIAQAAWRERG